MTAALKGAKLRMAGTGAMVRPWLQDFSLNGVTYGVPEVKAQIQGGGRAGLHRVDHVGSGAQVLDGGLPQPMTGGAVDGHAGRMSRAGPGRRLLLLVDHHGDQRLRVHVQKAVQRQPQARDDAQGEEAEHHEGLLEIHTQRARRAFQRA